VAQGVECLPSNLKALSSNPSIDKKNKNKKRIRYVFQIWLNATRSENQGKKSIPVLQGTKKVSKLRKYNTVSNQHHD
jgi:hypothetical protein